MSWRARLVIPGLVMVATFLFIGAKRAHGAGKVVCLALGLSVVATIFSVGITAVVQMIRSNGKQRS